MSAARLVRNARRRAGLTQRQLGQRAGVAQPAVARIESGAVSPRAATLVELLAAAGFALELAPRAGEGVDRSLIRASLARSPEARVTAARTAARRLRAFQSGVRSGVARGKSG